MNELDLEITDLEDLVKAFLEKLWKVDTIVNCLLDMYKATNEQAFKDKCKEIVTLQATAERKIKTEIQKAIDAIDRNYFTDFDDKGWLPSLEEMLPKWDYWKK